MPLTLLNIIQNVQGELGLPQSATVAGNTDLTTVQMFALANRILDEMRRLHPTGWSAMMSEWVIFTDTPTITTGNVHNNSTVIDNIAANMTSLITGNGPTSFVVSGSFLPQAARVVQVASSSAVQISMEATGTATGTPLTFAQDTYAYPTDYDWTQNRTQWDRTNRWELLGPDSAQMDQWHRSGIVATGPRRHWRKIGGPQPLSGGFTGATIGNQFRIWPAPVEVTNPLQLAFEYLSTHAVAVTGGPGTAQYFANDTDTSFLDDAAITMGI